MAERPREGLQGAMPFFTSPPRCLLYIGAPPWRTKTAPAPLGGRACSRQLGSRGVAADELENSAL